jgi:hypothetical protein
MAHKEYGVTDILDVLRSHKAKDSIKRIVRSTGMAKNTVRNYLRTPAEQGFHAGVADDLLPEIAAAVFRSIHGSPHKVHFTEPPRVRIVVASLEETLC